MIKHMVFAVMLASALVSGCRAGLSTRSNRATAGRSYACEQEWLAGEITRDMAEMCAFAGGGSDEGVRRMSAQVKIAPKRGASPAFDVKVAFAGLQQPVTSRLEMAHSPWWPDDYAGLASRLLEARSLKPHQRRETKSDAHLAALLEPSAAVIQRLNLEISQKLADDMLDAESHEAAALILGTFSLREHAGRYSDLRATLCRMTAHLALASALRGDTGPGLDGELAQAILLTQSVRSKDAIALLDRLQGDSRLSRAQGAWLVALRLRNTGDWRLADPVDGPDLLVRLEAARARWHAMGDAAVLDRLQQSKGWDLGRIPDYGRLFTDRWPAWPTLAAGHQFSEGATRRELAEAEGVWRTFPEHGRVPGDWTAALNEPRTRCLALAPNGRLVPQVLSWGSWAAFFQRHLCNGMEDYERFLGYALSLDDEARQAARAHDREFGGLDLYPFLHMWRSRETNMKEYLRACREAAAIVRRSPDLLTFPLYSYLREKAAIRAEMPWAITWFEPPLLPGVAYEGVYRLRNSLRVLRDPAAAAERLLALAPQSAHVVNEYLTYRKDRIPLEELRAIYGDLLAYDFVAMKDFASEAERDSPEWSEEFVEMYRRRCRLDADACGSLGYYLASRGHDEEAVEAYERLFQKAKNRLIVSQFCYWLVHHYIDEGNSQRALVIAQDAAEVYSASGLIIFGQALERTGHLDEARSYYARVATRYGSEGPLAAFCYRRIHRDGQSQLEPELREHLAKRFPHGLEKLDLRELAGPPADGVRIAEDLSETELLGVKSGDVIVALDGWRVHTVEQYNTIKGFDWSSHLRLAVWADGRYREVEGKSIGRLGEVELETYAGPPQRTAR